jgi:MFS family permease
MTATSGSDAPRSWRATLEQALLAPIRAFRIAYLPLLMVYFAYGALGLTSIAQSFWVRRELSLTPVDLAALNVWLTLPWSVKMVFGELVDTVPLFGSRRRSYVFLGAILVASSMVLLAAAAGGWLRALSADQVFVIASLLSVTGVVIQDVVADAMSTEVVARKEADGTPRPQADIDRDLGMVQVLGRLALYAGIFATAGLAGLLASWFSYQTVFLIGLVVPLISVTGAMLVQLESSETRPTDWRILGGGLAFGGLVTSLAFTGLPYTQEIILIVSLFVIITMLKRVTGDVPANVQASLFAAAAIIFAFRATPSIGEGYRWFMIDQLGFDETFFGVLQQTGAVIGLAAAWLFSDAVTRRPVTQVLFWITIAGTVLWLPNLVLIHGWHTTTAAFGFGAHEIALFDAAAASPLVQLAMIPMLTLIARTAPPAHRATWFALMASLMNLALVTGEVGSKILNSMFVIGRGDYSQLPPLAWSVAILGLVIPLAALALLSRRVTATGSAEAR